MAGVGDTGAVVATEEEAVATAHVPATVMGTDTREGKGNKISIYSYL